MDYTGLAIEFLEKMDKLRKAKIQKNITEALQGEMFVLHYIFHKGGEVLPGDISNEMGVSSARIATALNSLEKKGLITRQIDISDRRRIIVRFTEKGKNFADKHQQAVVKYTVQMLSLLGEHDAKEYVRITGRLAEAAARYHGMNKNPTH